MSNQNITSYIIYNPVYRQIKKYIKRNSRHRDFIVNTWNVCLYARDDILDMKLVWVKADSPDLINLIDRLVHVSDQHFFWLKFPTIVTKLENYPVVQAFINNNKLWSFVHKIETTYNQAIIRSRIKVITFHPSIKSKNILSTYPGKRNFIEYAKNLYITRAYGWLKPEALQHFNVKLRYRQWHVVQYLILDYHRTRRRQKKKPILNMVDLCALRLALNDPRYYQFDQCEIPELIHDELREIIQRKENAEYENIFNSTSYLVENGVQMVSPAVQKYFQFYISSYNSTPLNIPNCNTFSAIILVREYFELYSEQQYSNVLVDFIEKRPHTNMFIDGTAVPMTIDLIERITKYPNVFKLKIDTNFAVPFDELRHQQEQSTVPPEFIDPLAVSFWGHNQYQFLADCVSHLKKFLTFRPYTFVVNCPVTDYAIFNDAAAEEIEFLGHEINEKMISQLTATNVIKRQFVLANVTLVNQLQVKMLHEFPLIKRVELVQDDKTFELIFRFVENLFHTQNVTEMIFNCSFSIECPILNGCSRDVVLDKYTFKLDGSHCKIELCETETGNIVDLYEIVFGNDLPDLDFNFYQ